MKMHSGLDEICVGHSQDNVFRLYGVSGLNYQHFEIVKHLPSNFLHRL